MSRVVNKLKKTRLGKQASDKKNKDMNTMYDNITIIIPVDDALNSIYEKIRIDVNSINGIMESMYGKINIKIITPASGYGFDNVSNVVSKMQSISPSMPSMPKLFKKSDIQKIYENIIVKFELTFDEMMELEHYQKMIKYLYNVLRIRDVVLIHILIKILTI